jgi:eukaryotic-like serine/threonine-protein kinase
MIHPRAMPTSGGIVVTAGDVCSMDEKGQRGDSQSCFSPEELAAFVTGRLPQKESGSIAAHIQHCLECASLVKAARGGAFPTALGGSRAEDRFDEELEAEELASRALAFRPLDELESLPRDSRLSPLSGFYVGDRIGSGPHGTVYGGWHYDLNLKVALKVLRGGAAISHRRRNRLAVSTRAAADLAGSRVLPVLDTVRHDAILILVTPHIEGVNLATLVRDRRHARQGVKGLRLHPWARLSERRYLGKVFMVLDQLVDSVAKLHEAGALFRELKPSNCLVDQRGDLWLTDFGLARLLGNASGVWLEGAEAMGWTSERRRIRFDITVSAPGFTSPEEWSGRSAGRPADVFRLGTIMYQTITLELPYGISPVTPGRRCPTAPSSHSLALSSELDTVILRALGVDPGQRYPSALELREHWLQARACMRKSALSRLTWRWLKSMRDRVLAALDRLLRLR